MTVNAEPLLDASQIAANAAAIALLTTNLATHTGDASIHFADAPNDGMSYVRNSLGWQLETVQAFGEYQGTFDASGGSFPVTPNQGDWFNCTVAGTVDGQAFIVGDLLIALVDTPSTTTFAGNWSIVPNISVTDHTLLTNIGVTSHADIDLHIADTNIHFADAPADAQDYVRNNNAWVVASPGGVTDHGALTGLADDDHSQYLLLLGRAGGQAAFGGTAAGDSLDLQGSSNADVGRINMLSPVEYFYSEGNTTPAEQSVVRWRPTFVTAGAYIGGWFANNAQITYTNAFYIYSSIQDNSVHISNAAAGFQAWTLFNALCSINNGTSNASVQAITLNDGVSHRRVTAGVSTAIQHVGCSITPAIRADVAAATMTWSVGAKGLTFAPKWNTQTASSVVNMGTLCAVQSIAPGQALFGASAGTENITNIFGHDFPAMVNPVSGIIAVTNSALNASGTTRWVINATGTAPSRMGGNLQFTADLFGTIYGAGQDVTTAWGGAGFYFWQFNALADQLRLSNPAAGRFLFDDDTGAGEFNFNCARFSLGAQTGAVGNQVGVFVAGTRSVGIGGGWADFLLTQAGNLTVNAAMSQVFGWSINATSITLGTGSVVDAGGLLVGGNVSQGTNRYGMLILSNPSGGTINEALRVQNGRSRFADLFHEGTNLGLFGATPGPQFTVTGSRGGNAALADLLTKGAVLGYWIDGSSA